MNPRRRQGRDGESHPTSSRRFQLRGGGDLKRSLPEKHDTLRPYLVAVDVLIRMDAPTVKQRVGMMPPESGMRVGALISDLESVEGLRGLGILLRDGRGAPDAGLSIRNSAPVHAGGLRFIEETNST